MHAITLSSLAAVIIAATACASAVMPEDIASFVSRRDQCDHFRGEIPEPDDVGRMQEVARAVDAYCFGTDRKLAALLSKYQRRPSVLARLHAYEPEIEAPDFRSHDSDEAALRVIEINASELDPNSSAKEFPIESCQRWSLTAAQAETFFRLSEPIDIRTYVHDYDTSHCRITGRLIADGELWDFAINGGAKAAWERGDDFRYLGCSAADCEPLVIFMQMPPESW